MTSLLHLDSGANISDDSVSRQLTALYARTWRATHGPVDYRYRDLVTDPVAPLDTAYCALGRRLERDGLVPLDRVGTRVVGPAEERQWALTKPLIDDLLAADTVLIGAPMYNYSVPASLKAWIDRVSFPGAFVDLATGESLLGRTKIVLITPRGGSYGAGSAREGSDFVVPYLRYYFTRHGVTRENLAIVDVEMTLSSLVPRLGRFRSEAARSLAAARAELRALASASERDIKDRVP